MTAAIPKLGYYKLYDDSQDVEFATEGSACFDIRSYSKSAILISPGERVLVPTGLVFDIPKGYHLKVHIRSSVALKLGLSLANSTGIIDYDYTNELLLPITNNNRAMVQVIQPGTRIAQAELVKSASYQLKVVKTRPGQKTNRTGGLGSTGEK